MRSGLACGLTLGLGLRLSPGVPAEVPAGASMDMPPAVGSVALPA